MLNVFRMLIHPSSGACNLFVELFHGMYCSGSMCVGVTLWYGCGGVVSVCRLRHNSASTCIRKPHHHSQTTSHQHTSNQSNTTHEITQQISRKLLRMDVLTSETRWALNNEIIKQVASSWSLSLFNYQDDARSNKHNIPLLHFNHQRGHQNHHLLQQYNRLFMMYEILARTVLI